MPLATFLVVRVEKIHFEICLTGNPEKSYCAIHSDSLIHIVQLLKLDSWTNYKRPVDPGTT